MSTEFKKNDENLTLANGEKSSLYSSNLARTAFQTSVDESDISDEELLRTITTHDRNFHSVSACSLGPVLGPVIVIFCEIFLTSAFGFLVFWLFGFQNGLSKDADDYPFNYHPLIMSFAFFLETQAVLCYRISPFSKRTQMILHVSFHLLSAGVASIGLLAVGIYHERYEIPTLYSFHSWLGITIVVLFGIQFCMGFLAFVMPRPRYSLRVLFAPFHRFFGTAIFCLLVLTICLGLMEKLSYLQAGYTGNTSTSPIPKTGVQSFVVNLSAVFFALAAVTGTGILAAYNSKTGILE